MHLLRSLICFLFFIFFFAGCKYFNTKKLTIHFEIGNTGSLDPKEVIRLINSRVTGAFDLSDSDVDPGKLNGNKYSCVVNGLPKDTGLEKKIRHLYSVNVNVGFWSVYSNTDIFNYLKAINDTLGKINMIGTKRPDSTQFETEYDSIERSLKRNPLFAVLQYLTEPGGYYLSEEAACGMSFVNDTETVMKLLHDPSVAGILPQTCKIMWGPSTQGNEKVFKLYFLRPDPYTKGPSLELGQVVESSVVKSGGVSNSISFTMNDADAKLWNIITSSNVDHFLAISLDDRIISAPKVQAPITMGKCMITGDFNSREADDLAHILRAGKMPFDIRVIRIEEVK